MGFVLASPVSPGPSPSCSGGAVASPGSTVNSDSGFCTAMRRVDFLAGPELDGADFQNVRSALVEQFDDLRVQLVDGLAVLGDVHGGVSGRQRPACPPARR